MTLIPKPLDTPKSWLTGTFFGAIQQTQENTESAVNKNPSRTGSGHREGSKIARRGLTGQEEEEECSSEEVQEKSIPSNPTTFLVLFSMEGVQQSAGDQILRPHHTCGPDEETSTEAGQAETSQLCSQHKRDIKAEAVNDAIKDLKNHDGVQGIRRGDGDVGHDEHQYVFLNVPGSRVEGKFESTEPPW